MSERKDEDSRPGAEDTPEEEPVAKAEKAEADSAIAVVEPSPVATPGAPSGILEEALVQLKKLGDLREQEVLRQERLVTQMQDVVSRHSRMNRILLWVCGITLALLLLLAIGFSRFGASQRRAGKNIDGVVSQVDKTAAMMRRASTTQSEKLNSLQTGLATQLDNTVAAMRHERDEVRAEVREVLDDQNRNLVRRELELRDEEDRIAAEAELARQERLRIIGEAIDRLSRMAGELEEGPEATEPDMPDEPLAAPVEAPAAEPEAEAPAEKVSTEDTPSEEASKDEIPPAE